MNGLKIVTILVKDQDAALDFYVRKLGFTLLEDASLGESRWIAIGLPGQPGLALALELATTAECKAVVGKQAGTAALLAIDTSDCLGDYTRLKQRGVKFVGEPQSGPWGTGAQFEDLYGNRIFLSQEA